MEYKYTNEDIEVLLAQKPYVGDEDLQGNYEFLWNYMNQKEFQEAKENLKEYNAGEEINPLLVNASKRMINFAYQELEELTKEEFKLFDEETDPIKKEKINTWCDSLNRTHNRLKLV